MRKIVIVHGGAVGDFILALPAIAALRQAYPAANIGIVGRPEIAELAKMGGYADQIIALDQSGWHRLFVAGAALPEPLAADLRSCDGIVSWLGFGDETYRAALTAHGARVVIQKAFPASDHSVHVADYLIETIVPLLPSGFVITDHTPRLTISPAARQAAENVLFQAGVSIKGKRLIAIHPGSGSPKKCWPGERFAELAHAWEKMERVQWMVIEGPADEAAREAFELHYNGGATFRLRRQPLTELAAILSLCERFIGNDSGITHLAAAVGAPVLALFGPTDPAVWGPRGSSVQILHQPLESLSVPTVLRALTRLIT